jgi:pSer/pThr/pTyr-binding forkhead associated (FHA) protein
VGKSYALASNTVTLGRDASCDIVLNDANISRRHAQFTQDVIGTWKVTDLNSTNGTRVNGSIITSALLRDGDEVAVGVTILEFRGN